VDVIFLKHGVVWSYRYRSTRCINWSCKCMATVNGVNALRAFYVREEFLLQCHMQALLIQLAP